MSTTSRAIQCHYARDHNNYSCPNEADFMVKFTAPSCGHEYNYGRGLIHLYCKEHMRYVFSELVHNYDCVVCQRKIRLIDMFVSVEPL